MIWWFFFKIHENDLDNNVKKGCWSDKDILVSDRLITTDYQLHWGGIGLNGIGGDDTNLMVSISKESELYNSITDLSSFKQWLSENTMTLIYELEEPIIEELPNSITTQGFDDTTMYIENSITPTVQYGYNALIPYKEELSNQKEEVETNTLDIENNIIPYLMDMEFNLMLMEDNE